MPDLDDEYARRGGRLLPVLFWAGVGVAPLAGLLLLLGNGGSLRTGAFLGLLGLVLIGLSITLRPNPNTVRLQIEEMLLAELDQLRAEIREDMAGASRATHQMVGERLGAMQQLIETLRGGRSGAPRSAPPAAPYPAAEYQASRPVAEYQASRPVAEYPASRPVAEYPASRPVAEYPASRPVASRPVAPYPAQPHSAPPQVAPRSVPPPGRPAGRHPAPPMPMPVAGNGGAGSGRRGARHQADGHRAPAGGRPAASPTGGVYRHTETVQVTTRSTYVDEHPPNEDSSRRYDGGYGSRDWSGAVPRSRSAGPHEESWTDQKLRERYGRRPSSPAGDASGEQPWTRERAPWAPVSGEPVSGGTGGTGGSGGHRHRWDDQGSGELRLGERRAAARHSDRHGTELRLEERWASVRRDDNGYGRSDQLRSDRADPGERDPDYTRPALPAASSEPSWNDSWDEPAGESRGHRFQPGFELSDERWR
jgi:hypothetical protein